MRGEQSETKQSAHNTQKGFPFQLIVERKWRYKWIKWITAIEISDNEDYQGFWESQGYSNEGNFNKHFFNPIIPDFPSWIILPLLIPVVVIATIIYRKRVTKKRQQH